jgi:hypothetical protein
MRTYSLDSTDAREHDAGMATLTTMGVSGWVLSESARLMGVVGRLGVPADVVVVSEDHAREWGAVPGTMLHEALTQGRVVVDVA